MQFITRKGNFDSGHRVLNEARKCFNVHGHTYLYELTYQFEQTEDIGYAIDFKEIKRVHCQWIDDILDHGAILNPHDTKYVELCKSIKSKYWLMSLNGAGNYCNPSVENIAKEVFLAVDILTRAYPLLELSQVRIFETPNCWTDCFRNSIQTKETQSFYQLRESEIVAYGKEKAVIEYDDRKF